MSNTRFTPEYGPVFMESTSAFERLIKDCFDEDIGDYFGDHDYERGHTFKMVVKGLETSAGVERLSSDSVAKDPETQRWMYTNYQGKQKDLFKDLFVRSNTSLSFYEFFDIAMHNMVHRGLISHGTYLFKYDW